jgi:hypothetical protein
MAKKPDDEEAEREKSSLCVYQLLDMHTRGATTAQDIYIPRLKIMCKNANIRPIRLLHNHALNSNLFSLALSYVLSSFLCFLVGGPRRLLAFMECCS